MTLNEIYTVIEQNGTANTKAYANSVKNQGFSPTEAQLATLAKHCTWALSKLCVQTSVVNINPMVESYGSPGWLATLGQWLTKVLLLQMLNAEL